MSIALNPSAQVLPMHHTSRTANVACATVAGAAQTVSDTVTLSAEAQAKLTQAQSNSATSAPTTQRWQDKLLNEVRADPAFASRYAEEFAHDTSFENFGPPVNITNYPDVTYSMTGQPVTPQGLAAFKQEAATVRAGREALYAQEKAKGTPDAEILEKLFAYTDQQSDNYLSKLGWTPPEQTQAPAVDFTAMKPSELLDAMNDLIKSGRMSLDESSALLALVPTPLRPGMGGSGSTVNDDPMNVFQRLQEMIDNSLARQDNAVAQHVQNALTALERMA